MNMRGARSLLRDQRGLSTVEYTVLLVLIVACAVGLWSEFGEIITSRLQGTNQKLASDLTLPGE